MTFLQEVIGECKDRNVKFVNCEINSRQEILNFKEEHIVNCLGFSSKKLFGDNNLYGLKGHLLEFANPQGIEQFICIKHNNKPI